LCEREGIVTVLRRGLFCTAFALLLGPVAASANFAQTYLGKTTAASPTFQRPSGSGPGLGSIVHYHVQEFDLEFASTCYFYGSQDYDGYLHLYQGTFNPASSLTNLVAGDDDGDGGIGTSLLEDLPLPAGHYILVNSAWDIEVGTFQTAVHCTSAQPRGAPCNGVYWLSSLIPADDTVCLNNRFMIGIFGVSNSSTGGNGHPVHVASKDTAIFWFYDSDNFEVMLKVLNGCGINNHWWVFGGALTNQAYTILVFDTTQPEVPGVNPKAYVNAFGVQAPAITDINAFATCP